ncbi:hypothetical protein BS47DRAFT_1368973 [Hydnum rufescens UP504]|uniref:Uncharacterized protein n=1 Tax=Hydnum rufescens UP504 TaxID=1448309 RepID=A0A9P6AE45_9AGAM|nr:hypothetical protein BS47DRAFT_1368973 [Hydnum rufescens UP504]
MQFGLNMPVKLGSSDLRWRNDEDMGGTLPIQLLKVQFSMDWLLHVKAIMKMIGHKPMEIWGESQHHIPELLGCVSKVLPYEMLHKVTIHLLVDSDLSTFALDPVGGGDGPLQHPETTSVRFLDGGIVLSCCHFPFVTSVWLQGVAQEGGGWTTATPRNHWSSKIVAFIGFPSVLFGSQLEPNCMLKRPSNGTIYKPIHGKLHLQELNRNGSCNKVPPGFWRALVVSLPKERKGDPAYCFPLLESQGTSPKPGKGLVLMATRGQQDIQIEAAETRDKRQEGSRFSLGVEVQAKFPPYPHHSSTSFTTNSSPNHLSPALNESTDSENSNNTLYRHIQTKLHAKESPQHLGADISFLPPLCHGIYMTPLIYGLGRKALMVDFQCQYIQDDLSTTQGSAVFLVLGL